VTCLFTILDNTVELAKKTSKVTRTITVYFNILLKETPPSRAPRLLLYIILTSFTL
jgi:hypothetical protein